MSILPIIICLIGIGVILWAINRWLPMDAKIKLILNIFVVVCVIIWLLKVCGVWHYLASVKI